MILVRISSFLPHRARGRGSPAPLESLTVAQPCVIASLWRKRWLAGRIKNGEILSRVAESNAQTLRSFFIAAFDDAPTTEVLDEGGGEVGLSRASEG